MYLIVDSTVSMGRPEACLVFGVVSFKYSSYFSRCSVNCSIREFRHWIWLFHCSDGIESTAQCSSTSGGSLDLSNTPGTKVDGEPIRF